MEPVNAPSLPPLTIPTVLPDGDIIVPPTPTKQLLPLSETDGLTSGAVQPPGSTGENLTPTPTSHYDKSRRRDASDDSDSSFTDEGNYHDTILIDEVEDEEQRLIRSGGTGILVGPVSTLYVCVHHPLQLKRVQDGQPRPLLPPLAPEHAGRKCLVLDLDETLVHSSLKVSVVPTLSTIILTFPRKGRSVARLHCSSGDRGVLAQLLRAQTPRCR